MDLISRQAAIDAYGDWYVEEGTEEGFIGTVKQLLEKLPSAQPERMKGKWIRITQGAMPEQYICPFCHRTVGTYGVEELLSIQYPYCHCGADMRGEQHEQIQNRMHPSER